MRVLVAMSGGVDSSVAAALLKQRGDEVLGVTLDLHGPAPAAGDRSCGGRAGIDAAQAVAQQLGIEHQVLDGRQPFDEGVLRYCWNEYASGRTPNPCVRCNERVKLALMIDHADAVGATHVATGHHARVVQGDPGPAGPSGDARLVSGANRERLEPEAVDVATGHHARVVQLTDHAVLCRGYDGHKDQSYFLFALGPGMITRCLFPVGNLTKAQVRDAARQYGLSNAERPESQDACFAAAGAFSSELTRRFGEKARPGVIRTVDGRVLGRHEGVHRFTIGQRKGLGVALGDRAYVVAIDAESGEVVLGSSQDLVAGGLVASGATWWTEPAVGERISVEAQIRYRHRAVPATLWRDDAGEVMVEFTEPQQAVTPGQAVVFYREDRVLGGAWIARALGGIADAGKH